MPNDVYYGGTSLNSGAIRITATSFDPATGVAGFTFQRLGSVVDSNGNVVIDPATNLPQLGMRWLICCGDAELPSRPLPSPQT
jgi:hypothetical protein